MTGKKYGVTAKSIKKWKQNEAIFKTIDTLNKKITLHGSPINRITNTENENYYMIGKILIEHWEIQLLLGLLA